MNEFEHESNQDAVAIIGMSCRFPGAESVQEYWDNLVAGKESISFFSDEQLLAAGIPPEKVADPHYVKARGLIKNPELFDAAFFGISPREAELMDPQQRLFLETCWHALESAGYAPSTVAGAVGVWGGMSTGMTNNTYLLSNLHSAPDLLDSADQLPAMLGNENDYLTTRVSYKLNLRGPSINVQSACSTSLVAAAQAFQSLMTYGCDVALAGGVSVSFPQQDGYLHQEGDIGSPDGHCRPFDADAQGTVFSNGVGVVVLKRLEDAIADDDTIYAVIRGSAINNDGSSKVSFAAPSVAGQAEVIAMAQAMAGVEPESVSYVETHGTGTALGDPIEVAGLIQAFGRNAAHTGYCGLGSVKSNFGHLDSAAGVAALIKTALCLHHKTLVPTLHFNEPNPAIDFTDSPFYICRETSQWLTKALPRRAGVSGFGIGGTNAHLLLEEAPQRKEKPSQPGAQLLLLSTKTEAALKQAAANLGEFLQQQETTRLEDVAYTLANGREQFRHRLSLVASSVADAARALASFDRSKLHISKSSHSTAAVVFMFPGGGAQYPNMAAELYQADPEFRADIDLGLQLLKKHHQLDLKSIWFAEQAQSEQAASELERPSVQLPAIFIVEMALTRLWQRRGVTPDALIGHSMGENTAACVAGVMSFESALGLVRLRGELFEQVEEGGMLSVTLSPADVQAYLTPDICLATINAPEQCTLSGSKAAIAQLHSRLEKDGVDSQRIAINVAAHSHLLDPILKRFKEYLQSIDLRVPSIPIVSNYSGEWLQDEQAIDPDYWVAHLRNTVMFAAGIQTLAQNGERVFLEVGPGKSLGSLVRLQQPEFGTRTIASLRHARESIPDTDAVLSASGRLWSCGVSIASQRSALWPAGRRIPLPLYPFQRKRFLVEPAARSSQQMANTQRLPTQATATAVAPAAVESGRESVSQQSRQQRILAKLNHIIQELSGLDAEDIDPGASFIDMGFDSLFLTQANLRFKKEFKVKITFRQLFDDAPCLQALAEYIDVQLPAGALPDTEPAPMTATSTTASATPTPATEPASALSAENGNSALAQALALQIQASNAMLALLQNQDTGQAKTPENTEFQAPAAERIAVPASSNEAPSATGRFGPFKPVQRAMSSEWTDTQLAYLDEFMQAVLKKTGKSKVFTAEHRPHFADPRAVSGFKNAWKEITYPLVGERSKGSRMWDIDGNEYIDCAGGFGATFFGHAPDFIVDALHQQLDATLDYAPQSKIAGPAAKLVCEMTGMDRASFCNTGSEAVLAAMRVARTVTGNELIVTFSGDYHGMFDEVLVKTKVVNGARKNMPAAPGIPASASHNILVLEYGDPASLDIIKAHADELAAVLIEPIQSRTPELQPMEFVQQVRKITQETGVPMIFDEIITGFRLHNKGAQAWYDVEADICCYGKVVGGGMPIGIIAGKSEYMDALDGGMWHYGDDSFPEAGVTYFAGTFIRHPLALVAVNAVLEKLKTEGPALQAAVTRRAAVFAEEVNRHFHRLGIPVEITYFASVILPRFYGNPDFEGLFYHHLRYQGIHIWEGRPGFLTTEHSDADIRMMIEGFVRAAETLLQKGFFPEAEQRKAQVLPWTRPQSEIWLTLMMGVGASSAYNEQIIFDVPGELDRQVLELTLDKVVNRHASLRAVVLEDESGIAVQPYMAPGLAFHDLSNLVGPQLQERLQQLERDTIDTPFDYKNGPLVRFCVIQQPGQTTRLCFAVSHLVCDGWSMEVVMQDIASYYTAMKQGRQPHRGVPPALKELDIIAEEKQESGELEDARQYWQQVFDTLPEYLNLPLDHPRPRVKTYSGERLCLGLEPALNDKLRAYARENNTTLFVVLLAAYYVLLHKLGNNDDIVVGIPAAGHPNVGLDKLVTHMVSFLPVRKRIAAAENFSQFLQDLRNEFNDAKGNQDLAYGDLVRMLKVPRDHSRLPLVSASFNMDLEMAPLWFECAQAKFVHTPRSFVKYDLFFNLIDEQSAIVLEVDHNTDLFDRNTVLQWVEYYQQILRDICDRHVATAIADFGLLNAGEEQALLQQWNATDIDYGLEQRSLVSLFEDRVDQCQDRIAVQFLEQQLSYSELDEKANQLAHRLRSSGIGQDQVVPVLMERSIEMVIALYGILKAGAAYTPLDPEYPEHRLQFILQQSGARMVLCQQQFAAQLPSSLDYLALDTDWASIAGEHSRRPGVEVAADDLAYVIYTSGSTGEPKGVMVEHRAICNRLLWMADVYPLEGNDHVLQKTPYTFDVSVWEFFLPLQVGARLVMAEPEGHKSPSYLIDTIDKCGITFVHFVPSMLYAFLGDSGVARCRRLKHVFCSGEPLTRELQDEFYRLLPDTKLHNLYGPTEAAVDVSSWYCDPTDNTETVPIGRPIANTQLYVLNETLQPQPAGVIGELYIGGVQLARGYLGRSDLTEQAFIANPFSAQTGARLYRTGDRVRQRPDGVIEYLGRNDSQVKLRGQRVELGEIDGALERHPAIKRAVSIVRQDRDHDQRLIAYICYEPQKSLTNTDLRRHLRDILPRYMIPQVFVEMAYLPLTPSGKVDRKALPEPLQPLSQAPQVELPQTETEQFIASVCCELLQLDVVGVEQNFFDIGGHSLLALELINRIEDGKGIKITPLDIMLNSLGQMAAQIDQHVASADALEANSSTGTDEAKDSGIIKRLFNKKALK